MTTFDGPSWIKSGESMDQIREIWQDRTHETSQSVPVTGNDRCDVDAAVRKGTTDFGLRWHDLIGEVGVRLGSDASKMNATGENYSSTEEQSSEAILRFWRQ